MLKTSGPRALALDKELGPWSTLSEASHHCLLHPPAPVLSSAISFQLPWILPPGFSHSALLHITNDLNLASGSLWFGGLPELQSH